VSKNRNAYCSFCKKSFVTVGPLVEGPGEVYICGDCIELTQSIMIQEKCRRSNDPDAYLRERIERLAHSVDIYTYDPHELLTKAFKSKQPALFESISALYEATTLLSIVSGILERIKAKGLNSEEVTLLEDVAPIVTHLRTAINARADKELRALT
jgi:hypothetical protein